MPDRKPLILCVDDNDGARYALVRTLERAGFRTAEAATGGEALRKVEDNPDLIVLDVQLPDLSGYDVCSRIKRNPKTAHTPVLQVSADFVEVEHRTRGLELGADAYLAHPIEPPELIATIRALLRARRAEEAARAAASQLQSTFDAIADGICLLDANGNVLRCNREMSRITGRPEDELIGRSHADFLPAVGSGIGEDPFRRMVKSHEREVQLVEHAGRYLRLTSDPVFDELHQLTGAVYVFSDVTERQRAQEERERLLAGERAARSALERSESRFKRLAESELFGVLEATLTGELTWLNETARRMLGLAPDEPGQIIRWDRITPPEFAPADANAIAQLEAHGVCTPYEKEYLRPDGTRVPVLVGITMLDQAGHAVAFVIDLTRVRRLERDLREKVAELENADRRKDEFLAMLAHELRNPLAAITTGMHLLNESGSHAPDAVRLRATLLRQVGMLTRLVDDLLDVSRITRGKVELRRERMRLGDALNHAIATVRPLLEERRHELRVTMADEALWVDGDLTRIEQVISNLISNAAKYTEPGGIIEVILTREANDAVLRVRDNGIGLAPEMTEHVFELFRQVDQSPARSRGGLGVGLTLVRTLAEMHGGKVIARSEGLGKGSEFEVRLPLLADQSAPSAPPPGLPEAGARKRLLLVEDNPDIGETLRELLQLFGHRVELAGDGVRGVQLALALKPDAALVDIGLPGIDGYEVARRIRASEVGRQVILVALTGYGRPEDRDRALEAGFDAHLVKPVDPDELSAMLMQLQRRA